jgi:hypothetical protein
LHTIASDLSLSSNVVCLSIAAWAHLAIITYNVGTL